MLHLLVGIDVVDVARFRRFVANAAPEQLQDLFTARELASVDGRADRVPGLAARFAAKEAVIKALADVSPFALDWCEVEIVRQTGAPRVQLHGELAALAREQGVDALAVSLSHSRSVAVAQVVAMRGPARGSGADRESNKGQVS